MAFSPLSLSRTHVLGDLYSRCEHASNIPVYLTETNGDMIGYVDESQGKYADAFTFYLSEEICKKLAAGHFMYSFDYEYAETDGSATSAAKRRVKLTSITLIMRKGYDKPVPKSAQKEIAKPTDTTE
jgi:hypothetical protein